LALAFSPLSVAASSACRLSRKDRRAEGTAGTWPQRPGPVLCRPVERRAPVCESRCRFEPVGTGCANAAPTCPGGGCCRLATTQTTLPAAWAISSISTYWDEARGGGAATGSGTGAPTSTSGSACRQQPRGKYGNRRSSSNLNRRSPRTKFK